MPAIANKIATRAATKTVQTVANALPFAEYAETMGEQCAENIYHDRDRWGYLTRLTVGLGAGVGCALLPYLPATGSSVTHFMSHYLGLSQKAGALALATTGAGAGLYLSDRAVDQWHIYRCGDSKPFHHFSEIDAKRARERYEKIYTEQGYDQELIDELLHIDVEHCKTVTTYFDARYHLLEVQHLPAKFSSQEKKLDKQLLTAKIRPETFAKHADYELKKIAKEQEELVQTGKITATQEGKKVDPPHPSIVTRMYHDYLEDREHVLHTLDPEGLQRRYNLLQTRKQMICETQKGVNAIKEEHAAVIARRRP